MTDGQNQRLGAYVETSAAGERVRVYGRAIAAVGRLDGVTTILPSTPLFL